MNVRLRKDLKAFLDTYYKFKQNSPKIPNTIEIEGIVDIVDKKDGYWETYSIKIVFDENNYPNVIPIVIEVSNHIERSWNSHISKKGVCCLDIPHELIKEKRRGIILTNFYKNVIYPFFANHQFMLKEGNYANGEYQHFNDGIAQFYSEEFKFTEPQIIIKHLELALGITKADANKECPICGNPKYKKCCRPKVYKLLIYGGKQLEADLEMFRKR